MMGNSGYKCKNCFFIGRWNGAKYECRRYPPSLMGKYPLVLISDWCGEFKKFTAEDDE